MPSKTTAWLIRHAEYKSSDFLNNHLATINENGKKQANLLAEKVISKPDLIVVSPYTRAKETAAPLIAKWPTVPVEVWPIQEITYLDPLKFQNATQLQREEKIKNYWQALNPDFLDGDGAETFTNFINRLEKFDKQLKNCSGFIVVIGHGQFFKAYELGKKYGFASTKEWMERYRKEEVANPIANCAILKYELNK